MSETPYPAQNSTLAVISLIAGIGSWVIFPAVGAIVAIILGHMARREINESAGALSGDGMALAGLLLGYANLVFTVLIICVVLAFLFGLPLFIFSLETSYLLHPLI
ncbi:MAG: DUF4190 domain-containing protein [Chloroflexi bacterium]|nr:MAG: DUF4190 domain-containing protein [Chloroflexota bacterium]MBL1194581.1 DUF4190 domain-containing protein [Chloroflexota bacterium]NOH11870.1 DUF4190 domain-containing protein [Chloroflexota bacterium]